jgi:uroporphyrinogen decarboxylase
VGIELAQLGDDLGAQNRPLLSPRIVDEFLVPEYKRLIQHYKAHDVLIGFHCCGDLSSVLGTLIDLGVDLLDPIQATANDLSWVRTTTQGRVALQGGVSSAIIMEGPPARIRREVRHRLWQLGREGGYVCAPDQGMPYPKRHLQALEETITTFGRYPIEPPAAD